MKLILENWKRFLNEEDSDESLPPELRNLPQHIKDTIPADIRKKYMKGYPKLVPGQKIKTDSVGEGTVGTSPAQIPADTLLTVDQEIKKGRYSFKVIQPTAIKIGMSFDKEATISPDDELMVAGYQLWKHTSAGDGR
jgi:hypothetical protein